MPQALALKYRPRKFSDLIGQESVSQTLSLALDLDKVSHAYLFSGLRGSGKTSSARIFARAMQCEKSPTSVPCDECASCKAALDGSHLDIIEMNAADSRKIDDIRDLIEQIAYPPAFGRYKVFIIDEIHMLTTEAFNAFLKTLEEPPSYVKFILATTDPLKLPATILSRTQHFRFKKIPYSSISRHLKHILTQEGVEFEDEAIDLLSRNCGGSLRDSITMLEQAIIFSRNKITLESIASMLGSLNPSKIEAFFEAILVSKDEARIDALLAEFEAYEAENVISEMLNFLKSKLLERHAKYPLIILERFFRILGEAKNMLGINADSAFVLLLSAMKMREALQIQEIDKVIAKLEREIISEAQNAVESAPVAIQAPKDSAQSREIPSVESAETTKSTPIPSAQSPKNAESSVESNATISDITENPALKFKRLTDKIYERDYDMGELFAKNIAFVSLESGVLTWESRADETIKTRLKPYFAIIREIVNEIFGEVKIQNKTPQMPPNQSQGTAQSASSVIEMARGIFPFENIEKRELQ